MTALLTRILSYFYPYTLDYTARKDAGRKMMK